MERLNDWLQQHPLLIAIVGACGSALCGLGIRYAPNAAVVIALLVLLGACASAPAIATRLNGLHQGRRAAEYCLKRLLHACGHSFGYPERHVRVYLMRFSAYLCPRMVHSATVLYLGYDLESYR